jgi:hypothetical protein
MSYQLQKQENSLQKNTIQIATIEEFENALRTLKQGASASLISALNAQLQVIQYIQSPKLVDSSFDLLFSNLRRAIRATTKEQRGVVRERAQLMIHNYIFFLQAKLDYMIEDHSAAGKEVLIQATENIVTAAQELLQEGGISMEINQYLVATKIVSKFDGNFIQKVWNFLFGSSRIQQKYEDLMETLYLLFKKFKRNRKLIGESDIIPELIHRYRSEVATYKNQTVLDLLSIDNWFTILISTVFGWGILFLLGYYISGSFIDYSIPKNRTIIGWIGGLGYFIPLYIYLFVRIRIAFLSWRYERLASSFYPKDDNL